MVIDSRRVNSETEPMPFPMPQLEVSITHVIGATVFFSCDWFKGYWQLPLDPESQEYFTFMTHRGMYTPMRVPMGSSDAVAFCQHVVEEIFGDLIHKGVLAWLDDLLGYAATEDALCDLFDQVMERCAQYGLKLHPAKCVFFTRSIKWCGRIISADGVTHCPDRIQGLVDLAPPVTDADLQQLLCAANWMRTSIPEFARITGPLYSSLEAAMHKADSRKKRALRKVLLEECQWGLPEETSLAVLKNALIRITPLAHSKPDWDGGKFAGAASRWSIVEKEAFAVVESCQRLNYLLLRPGGFKLFTDHRNLLFIFNPYAVDAGIHRYQADKLQRWALGFSRYDYVIEHVAGEDNVWSDLLSRWGARTDESSRSIRVRRLTVVDQVAPLQTTAFEWPTLAEVRRIQDESLNAERQPSLVLDQERGIYEAVSHAIWISDDAVDLQQRICVIAQAGSSGHRGAKATRAVVEEVFTWSTVRHDVSAFVAGCIHWLSSGASRIPRPFGPTLQATAPNEVLHFDFLSLPRSANGASYLLVLKDGMSGYVELVLCLEATADVTRDALLDWFKRFGVFHHWVADQGSHFKNSIVAHLTKLFGAQHHFVTAYCPWANGSVEVVNRLVLRAIKTILSEFKLPISSWPSILPLVQHSLTCMPSDRIGGVAPLTAFTGLPSTSQLRAVIGAASVHSLDEATLQRHQQQTLVATRQALDTIHQAAVSTSDKRNTQNRQRQAQQQHVTLPRFEIGDFVLAAGVLPRRNKLALNWSGPKRVVASLNDFTFEVQDLMAPFHITVHHASRLQFYRDSQRGITQDLLDHAHYAAGGHLVDKLLEVRRGPDDYEIKVQWIGLNPLEASWEPATVILEDVPKLVRVFVAAHSRQKVFKDMWAALGDGPLPTNKTTGKSPVVNSKTRGGK